MNKEKQIEEIVKDLYHNTTAYNTCWEEDCEELAKILYHLGYRKQSEVAREIFEEIEEYAELQIESLNIAEKVDSRGTDFFGGGKQAFVLLLDRLAELKKKYTEGEI